MARPTGRESPAMNPKPRTRRHATSPSMASNSMTAASRSRTRALRGASPSPRSTYPRTRSRPRHRSRTPKSRATFTWTAFPTLACRFISKCRRPRSPWTIHSSKSANSSCNSAASRVRAASVEAWASRWRSRASSTPTPSILRALLESVGIAAPKTTDPKALGKVELAASWRLDGGAIAIEPLSLDARRHAFHRQIRARRG